MTESWRHAANAPSAAPRGWPVTGDLAFRLAISLAIGLLIGAERREGARRAASRRDPAFALASLAGGLSLAFGGETILVVTALVIGALTAVAYGRSKAPDPGLTTEVAS